MQTLVQDFRYGLRTLRKNPAFALIAIVALALGVGANTAIFSVVNAVLLRPLPFAEPDRLVRVYATAPQRGVTEYPTSYPTFADWREQNTTFDYMAAHSSAGASVRFGDAPESLEGVSASADLFPLLGVSPALGRVYTREDERPGARVVVISHSLWQRRFGSDPNVVGRQLLFDGESTTVVGVMPREFKFPVEVEGPEYWTPHDPEGDVNKNRGLNYLSVVARLKPGVTAEQAQAEMAAISRRLEEAHPESNTGRGVRLVQMHEDVVGDVRTALLVLLAAVGCVLLIACANVANLLLARSAARHKEIAIRTALGASRWRIVRQLLTESLMLSLAGGAAGLLLAWWGVDVLGAAVPADIPRVKEIALDARVLFFTLGLAVMTGVLFGLAPALQASKTDFAESLKEGGRGSTEGLSRNRVRSALVVAEVALSLMLLVGAGLLIRSFVGLRAVSPGFESRNVLTAGIALPTAKYADMKARAAIYQRAIENVAALPGVTAVGGAEPLPFSGNGWQTVVNFPDRPPLAPGERLSTHARVVTPDYFRAMGVPVQRGRAFTERDDENSPQVVVVNETFARKYFPDGEAVGKRVRPGISDTFDAEIVGVVGDVKHRRLDEEATPELYATYLQAAEPFLTLVVRADTNAAGLANAVRAAVLRADPDQPLYNVKTMEELLAESVAGRRFNMLLISVFAAVALMLAGVGIFGVMSYSVARRTHEIGIRMALGAQGRDVLRLVVGQGMALTLMGVGLGLAGAFALTRVLSSLLYGVTATDPATFAGVALILSAVALLACYVPARRATKVDPMIALRYE